MIADAKSATAGLGQDLAELANDLAQDRTRLRFRRFAPEQADQPLTRLQKGLAERDIAKHGPQLQAFDPDLISVMSKREGAEQ